MWQMPALAIQSFETKNSVGGHVVDPMCWTAAEIFFWPIFLANLVHRFLYLELWPAGIVDRIMIQLFIVWDSL